MAIYQRENGVWYADIQHGSQRIRRSLHTTDQTAAQEVHDKIKHELWRKENLGDKPKRTWDEAALRWLQETSHKADHKKDAAKIRDLKRLRGLRLDEIGRDEAIRAVEPFGPSGATKNRYLALIRAILRRAHRTWDWLDKAPCITLLPEGRKRIRWLTQDEARKLIAALPPHLAEMATFSLATGLRQANVFGLRWEQVDMQRHAAWIHHDQAKGRRAIGVPLNRTAMDVLQRQLGKHQRYVFTNSNGEPVQALGHRIWQRALEIAGITDFRWHDLRHTWASWLVQSGVPLAALQEMGGWETPAMVQRYAHLSPEHLLSHAAAIDTLMATNDTNTAQQPRHKKEKATTRVA